MITLKNPSVTSEWIINLKEYPQVENSLPMSGLNVRNDSNIPAYVDLDGLKVGEVQRYSADPFQGRNFSLIRIYNPDGQDFAPDDLFIQATKGEVVGSQPFNPQWDMMFFDLDRYSAGCDSRISLRPTVTADMVKYIINAQNKIMVQRRLDVFGSANNGSFIINFGGCDILNSSVAKEMTVTDLVQYRKTISDSELDYTETNCAIIGWVMDYLFNPNDISGDYTIILGTDGANYYDDNLETYSSYTLGAAGEHTVFEVEFSSKNIKQFHTYVKFRNVNAVHATLCRGYVYSGSWIEVFEESINSTTFTPAYVHESGTWDNVTKIKITLDSTVAAKYFQGYDLSVFP